MAIKRLANKVVRSYFQVDFNKASFLVPSDCNFAAFAALLGCTTDTTFWYQIPGAGSKIVDDHDEQSFAKLVGFGKQQHFLGATLNVWKHTEVSFIFSFSLISCFNLH